MTHFLTEDFLLDTEFSRRLYHEFAEKQPIFDYHCHLPPGQIAMDDQFNNLYDIWLKGDHYKWRAMRTHGIDERFCTGDAQDFDKFYAFAQTVPYTIGNPLYHWTHLELRRPFGLTDTLLSPKTAKKVWEYCNGLLSQPNFSARGIMQQMNVKMVGTTDDPIDDLKHHKAIADDKSFTIKVLPSWRPDKVFNIDSATFASYISSLEAAADTAITSFDSLCDVLSKRMDYFAAHGCKISDHALDTVVYQEAKDTELDTILLKRLKGEDLTSKEIAQFKTAVLLFLGAQYHKRDWVQQYHIGAMRNNNTLMFDKLGADVGFDSINDTAIAMPLSCLLDAQARHNSLPKTILYCLNSKDNDTIATILGNFQQGGIVGKMQFGSGWWFQDQKEGMQKQLNQLSQMGLLSHFVGMLTDSRSFLSYTRHEYFRRVLCQMVGRWVADGEAPSDIELLGRMVSDICFDNAKRYFAIELS